MVFIKPPRSSAPTPHLFVANCGPALALPLPTIRHFFTSFGPVISVQEADNSGSRVIVSFYDTTHAQAARDALDGLPCSSLQNRVLHIQYSMAQSLPQVEDPFPVCMAASDTGIPGLFLYKDFITGEKEQELLAAVDERPWQILSKRRVQHYGYEFKYKIRNVDNMQKLGELPDFVNPVVEKISALPHLAQAEELSLPLDQLTVNEYPPGVGLSPHIDTHSAFEGAIISLSLAGPCVMEFRKYETELPTLVHEIPEEEDRLVRSKGNDFVVRESCADEQHETPPGHNKQMCSFERRAIFLPERSLLVLSEEARYEWHHYIPHHKIDFVDGQKIQRKPRRVSFTFRKVRQGPCSCKFEYFCDSQASALHARPDCLDNVKIDEARQSNGGGRHTGG